jgi:hypothetical protein
MLMGTAMVVPAIGVAQVATPEPSPVLAPATVDAMPGPRAEVWFYRLQVDPGGSLPPTLQIGPTLLYVESGSVAITSDHPLGPAASDGSCPMMPGRGHMHGTPPAGCPMDGAMMPGMGPMHGTPAGDCPMGNACPAGTPMMDQQQAQGSLEFGSGQSLLVPEASTIGLRNDDDQPATVMVLSVFTGEQEVKAAEAAPDEEPVGVLTFPISVGIATFQDGPHTMSIERTTIAAGAALETASAGGIDLGALEAGAAEVTFHTGTSMLWPGMLMPAAVEATAEMAAPDRVNVSPGSTQALTTGDAWVMADGTATWAAGDEEAVVILHARVLPG